MSKENPLNYSQIELNMNDEIYLESYIGPLIRNKKFIATFTLITSILSVFYSNRIKPIYRGSMEILATENNNDRVQARNPEFSGLITMSGENFFNRADTRELVLQSSFVLNPVFEFVKKEYERKGISTKNMKYNSWFKKEMKVQFKNNTDILSVEYFNNDKDLIINTLNLIHKTYQNYSTSLIEKETIQGIEYLEEQLLKNSKSLKKAYKTLNDFSIENGIGDDESFVSIEQLNTEDVDNNKNKLLNQDNKNGKTKRFRTLFVNLENYEALYKKYSIKLKPNSQIMKDLELKINNLKEALKRPNEILIKYKQLSDDVENKEILQSNITSELTLLKFQKAKKLNPWILVSNPTLDRQKVSPNKKAIFLKAFIGSIFLSCILSLLYEKRRGILYESKNISNQIPCRFIGSINLNNLSMSLNFIKNSLIELNQQETKKLGLYTLNSKKIKNYDLFIKDLKGFKTAIKLDEVNLLDYNSIKDCESLIILFQSGNINVEELSLLIKYIKLNKNKVFGWIFIENTN